MEKLHRAQIPLRISQEHAISGADNPIELDNKAFDIVDGDKKTLDYLDYSGTIAKGTLAANGIIKLYPDSFDKYRKDYGAIATPSIAPPPKPAFENESYENDFENEWDNIFIKHNIYDNEYADVS